MSKSYNAKKVKSNRSYSFKDVVRVMVEDQDFHIQTLRKWRKSGKLRTFNHGRKDMVYGAIFKDCIDKHNISLKEGKLKFKEFKCFKCQKRAEPLDGYIHYKITDLGSPKAYGVCPNCGNKFHKHYSKNSEEKLDKNFLVDSQEVERLYDSFSSRERTHLNDNIKRLESEPNKIKFNSNITQRRTHLENEQQNLFGW